MHEFAVHAPEEVPGSLPKRLVLQTHWLKVAEIQMYLRKNRFAVVVMGRHPLDVLLSILHKVTHSSETSRWLNGAGRVESLIGKTPVSQEFFDFATGSGSKALLSVTQQWWDPSSAVCVRYEDLLASTELELLRVARELGLQPVRPVEDVVRHHGFEREKDWSPFHKWQGKAGLWKKLILPELALAVMKAHGGFFDQLGYSCEPDALLTRENVLEYWGKIAQPPPFDRSAV